MKIFRIFLFISFIYLTGCSSTIQVKHDYMSYKSLNEELTGERCDVLMADSTLVTAEKITVYEDSASIVKLSHNSNTGWYPIDTIRIPTADIQSIQYTDNGVGALMGLAYGTTAGLLFLALRPAAVEDAQEEQDDPISKAIAGAGTSMLFGGMGLLAPLGGLFWGAIIGHDYECMINHSDGITDIQVKKINFQELSDEDKSPIMVELGSIIEKGNGFIVIRWHEKKIRLERFEYNYRGTTNEGRQFIIVPKYIYRMKFN